MKNLAFLALLALSLIKISCNQKITTLVVNGEKTGVISNGPIVYDVRASPYINAMPGTNSKGIIIPIEIESQSEEGTWPLHFKLLKAQIMQNGEKLFVGQEFDHLNWMDSSNSSNAFRIINETIQGKFDLILFLKDNKRNRYQILFKDLVAGYVY